MVIRDSGSRYVGSAEGAPPLPPPGGYRGAQRVTLTRRGTAHPDATRAEATTPDAAATVEVVPRPRAQMTAMGMVALTAASVFGFVLLVLAGFRRGDLIYNVTSVLVQVLVLAVVIVAVVSKRSRLWGAMALTAALLINVVTTGALASVSADATGTYAGVKSDEQLFWEAYPGMKDVSRWEVLEQRSLEEARDWSEELMADVRERLSQEYGFTWTQIAEEDLRPERNGYGGESMLQQFTSVRWSTNEPVRGYDLKMDVLDTIADVIADHGLYRLYELNGDGLSITPEMKEKLFGGTEPRNQPAWEAYATDFPGPMRFYADIYDLSAGDSDIIRQQRTDAQARTGEPAEALQLMVLGDPLLSDADRDEFERRMAEYQ
ncbi:hypothetical protein [Microbacterium sp. YY-01]|uniref:hypothetical protein n=1 Tax=Microbacterium sp. YY-01 TaxID=3421634 RepID=UPI003D183807